VLRRLAAGEQIGTQLLASTEVLTARKQWLADHLQVRGKVRIDDGATRALVAEGKSLLPIGVVEVLGDFDRGDLIACIDGGGREVARGLTNYGAEQARRIARRPSSEIEAILGFLEERELIHRDNLVVL
jgi:glutamate 5-kinase